MANEKKGIKFSCYEEKGSTYVQLQNIIPNPFFPIYVSRIYRAKHRSDTGTYDTEGRFVPNKFEELWTKYAKSHTNKMTFKDLMGMTAASRALERMFHLKADFSALEKQFKAAAEKVSSQ